MLPGSFSPSYLRQLELLRMRARRNFLGTRQGGHASPKRGHGIEFSDYRKYELGDNPRHIDWGVYARSDRVYVKRFQEEQDLSVLILLDSSASMNVPGPNSAKWQRAKDVALSLAYVALMQQDRVCIAAPSLPAQPFVSGGRAVHRLSELVETIRPSAKNDFVAAAQSAIARVRFPGIAIIISDLFMPMDELAKITSAVRAKNLDATVIQLLGTDDLKPALGPIVAVDSESGVKVELSITEETQDEYRALFTDFQTELISHLHQNSMGYSLCTDQQPLGEYMTSHLARTGLLG